MISVNNSALALVSIMILLQSVLSQNLTQVACGNGITGNGVCDDSTLCCSSYGYCGTGADFCTMVTEDPATTAPVSNAPVMAPPANTVALFHVEMVKSGMGIVMFLVSAAAFTDTVALVLIIAAKPRPQQLMIKCRRPR